MQLNYRKEFLKSPEHAWTVALTLGAGLAVGNVVGLLAGTAAYALSWIYLPDMPFFKRRIDAKADGLTAAENEAQAAVFRRRRDQIRAQLNQRDEEKYAALVQVSAEIEQNNPNNGSLLAKLDELMWTFLKLLTMEEAIERFLREGQGENLDEELKAAQDEAAEMSKVPVEPGSAKEKLLNSRQKTVEVLNRRREAVTNARDNLGVVQSEEERLGHQIRLLRAESVSTRNSDLLTEKINSSVETLEETNQMLAQMSDYQDFIADMPPSSQRIGYGEAKRKTAVEN